MNHTFRGRANRAACPAVAALAALAGVVVVITGAPTVAASTPPANGGNPTECVDDWQGERLFGDEFKVQWAENYSLEYHENYKVLTVAQPYPGGEPQSIVLLQCGTELPALDGDLAAAPVVEIPVTSLYSASTSHLGFLDVLGLADVVTGIGTPDFVVTPSMRARIDAGDVVGFAPTFEVDAEAVIAGDPDVLVTGGFDDPAYAGLIEAGVPVVPNAEWLEVTPKGWAEWVGFFAALTNTEATASALYEGWVDEYDEAAALAASATTRPTVITGSLFEGTWYANGGGSISAHFIADAGGDYVYADDTGTGTLEFDIEAVLANGSDADVWIGPGGLFTTRSEAVTVDERYGQFAAWDAGGVWDNGIPLDPTRSVIETGPTMIGPYLLDYIKILQPDLAVDHEFVFFQEIPNT